MGGEDFFWLARGGAGGRDLYKTKTMEGLRRLLLVLLFQTCHAVDRAQFRTCSSTGFCKRHRSPVDAPPSFKVLKESVASHGLDGVSALLQADNLESPPLRLNIRFYDSGVVRLQVCIPSLYFRVNL